MEHGDLAISARPYYVVVLEGVLATITPIEVERRLRSPKVVGFNISWMDLPLRRFATMQRQYPDVGAEIITFHSQGIADTAADYLQQADVPFEALSYQPFDTWVSMLSFRSNLQAVFDSEESRLDRYGQVGKSVQRGQDFI